MNRKQLTAAIVWVVVIAAFAIAGVVAYYYIRQPDKAVTLNQASSNRIWALLKEANYVSPNYPTATDPNRAIYLITYKGCESCAAYEKSEFGKFRAAGIDTRVYVFSPLAGQSKADNAAIVQLWLSRDWNLYQRWIYDPKFSGEGVPTADDMARKYVLKATQEFYTKILAELPSKNPSDLHAPFVMWAKGDQIRVCFCDIDSAYHHASDDFGLQGTRQLNIPAFEIPENIPGFGGSSSSSASKQSVTVVPAAGAASSSASQSSTDFGPDT